MRSSVIQYPLDARAEHGCDAWPAPGFHLVRLLDQRQRRENAGDKAVLNLAHIQPPDLRSLSENIMRDCIVFAA